MNNVYIKSKDNLTRIILKNILFILPIIGYGIYKNGILLYNKNIIDFYLIFKVLYLIFIGIILDIIKRGIFKEKVLLDYDMFYMILIPLFMPYNINIYLYTGSIFILLIIYNFLNKIIKINKVALFISIIYLVIYYTQGIIFKNPLEKISIYSFNNWDLLFGRNIGGISSTAIVFAYIYLILNSLFNNYKYIIPITSIISYLILSILIMGINTNIFINSSVILSLILVLSISEYSPNRRRTQFIYGILGGIFCSLYSIYFDYYIGTFLGILTINLIYTLIISKKENKLIAK